MLAVLNGNVKAVKLLCHKQKKHSADVPILIKNMFAPNIDVNQTVCFQAEQHHLYGISLGFTALHVCVSRQTTVPSLVYMLIEAGANVNMKDHRGYSALHLAAMKGDVAVTKLLLNTNVDIDATNDHHQTPLMLACGKAFSPTVCYLLCKKGASVGATCLQGKVSTFFCCCYNSLLHFNCS